jgi:hypothetical protein
MYEQRHMDTGSAALSSGAHSGEDDRPEGEIEIRVVHHCDRFTTTEAGWKGSAEKIQIQSSRAFRQILRDKDVGSRWRERK